MQISWWLILTYKNISCDVNSLRRMGKEQNNVVGCVLKGNSLLPDTKQSVRNDDIGTDFVKLSMLFQVWPILFVSLMAPFTLLKQQMFTNLEMITHYLSSQIIFNI